MSVASNCTNSRTIRGVKFLGNPCPANQCKLAYFGSSVCRTCTTSNTSKNPLNHTRTFGARFYRRHLRNNPQLSVDKQCVIYDDKIQFEYLANISSYFRVHAGKIKVYLDGVETRIGLSVGKIPRI